MARLLGRFLLVLLLVLPSTIMLAGNDGSSSILVAAQEGRAEDAGEDAAEGEESDDATVENEEAPPTAGTEAPSTEAAEAKEGEKEEAEAEDEEKPLRASPSGDTTLLFTKPVSSLEFPAGSLVKLLVGFTNKGVVDFTVDSMEASFRYPQDYSFHIQNFTAVRYDKLVETSKQATFEYAFTPSDTFNARPFGLVVNLNYKDADGNLFQDAVFNDTIQIVDPDEGFDGETFFLYVFLAAVVVLLLLGAQQLLATYGKKRLLKPRQYVETGTQNKTDVDYDWLPKETLQELNKSPRRSPKQSPRQRRTKRGTGSVDE